MIWGILLAAGSSTRFGSDKRLHALPNGLPMAVAAARTLRSGVDRAVAVVRPDDHELAALLAAEGLGVVRCTAEPCGMGESIATGVRAAAQGHACLIALADMPFIKAETIAALVHPLRAGKPLVAPIFESRLGHPVGFGARFIPDLMKLHGDCGARAVVEENEALLTRVPVEDVGTVRDIDTAQELEDAIR